MNIAEFSSPITKTPPSVLVAKDVVILWKYCKYSSIIDKLEVPVCEDILAHFGNFEYGVLFFFFLEILQ